ncbi:MAG: ABC transporter ATP-binding protein, partial [Clostridia bacterium]|nr:ABC transporter ATP-binding protein [Clostridia bacterium]
MKNKSSTNKWIIKRTRPFIPKIIFISVLNILASVTYILLAKASQLIINNTNSTKNALVTGGISLFALIIIYVIVEAAISLISVSVSSKMNISLRNHMFTSLMKKKYVDISEYHSGDLLNRFTSDTEQIVNGTVVLIPSVVSMLTKIIAGVVALCIENYFFAFAVLVIGFVFPLVGRLLSSSYKKFHKDVQKSEGVTRSFLQESFANIIVIKTFSGETPFKIKLNEYMADNHKLKLKRNILSVIISMLIYLFFNMCYYGVLVWGAGQIASGQMLIGTLIYFLQLISILRAPLQNISGIMPRFYSTVASAERLIELENLENENNKPAFETPVSFQNIVADKLTFAYTNEIVLRDNNFIIDRGTITAITGRSGSGKSTLFKLLLGLFPATAGGLSFDGTTPIDETTRQMFSYVPQGNMIISGTIRDNISLCNSTVNEEDIIKAAKAAVIYDFIKTL